MFTSAANVLTVEIWLLLPSFKTRLILSYALHILSSVESAVYTLLLRELTRSPCCSRYPLKVPDGNPFIQIPPFPKIPFDVPAGDRAKMGGDKV